MFNKKGILAEMETMRMPNGAFIASPTRDYEALWIRDALYINLAYWYLGKRQKLLEGVWVIFDLLKKHRGKPIHAKYHPITLEEICAYDEWGHHQLDAVGLFLFITAKLHKESLDIIRDDDDRETIRLLVAYLHNVAYWQDPDYGMWEECFVRHSSSVGACLRGLIDIRDQRLATVPDALIERGMRALEEILPYESRDCAHHKHDYDAAQLSLIWPYQIVSGKRADDILSRIRQYLVQEHGSNRYWGDDYYRSDEAPREGISAEWPLFLFWISIIYAQRQTYGEARAWFAKGCATIVGTKIPEAYKNGRPNDHTPLAWAHAMALIAFSLLSEEQQKAGILPAFSFKR